MQKLGLKAEQRDGVEYEFTCVFDVAINHEAEATKDRTSLFTDRIFKVTEETAVELKNWLAGGKDVCAELLKEIQNKLKHCPDDYAEQVGSYLDEPGNDKDEKKLLAVDAKVTAKLNEVATQEAP